MDVADAALFGAIAGALCGLAPLIYGIVKQRVLLGVAGLAACVVAGAILGLILAIAVAAVFVHLIYRSVRGTAGTTPDATTS